MKKLVAMLLCLCLLCAGLALAESDVFVGTWYLYSISVNGTTVSAADMGFGLTMILNADGTGSSKGSGGISDVGGALTWTVDGDTLTIVPANADPSTATLVDGNLVWDEEDGMKMILSREEPSGTEMPGIIAATSEDQFMGEWDGDTIVMNGMTIPLAGAELNMHLSISAGRATMTYSDQSASVVTTFTDGKLIMKDFSTSFEVNLCEDGRLMLIMATDENNANVYFSRAN